MEENEKKKEIKQKKGKRIDFLREIGSDKKIKPLTEEQLRGYDINKASLRIHSEIPGNDR